MANIRLLAVGIKNYVNRSLGTLPTAIDDARSIYETFQVTTDAGVDTATSLLATDVTASQLTTLLGLLAGKSQPEDSVFVFYFSGHATISDEEILTLHCSDSANNSDRTSVNGTVSGREVAELLRRAGRPKALILLDCCFSGLGGSIADKPSPFYYSNTTVVASSGRFEESEYGPDRSRFTDSWVSAMRDQYQRGKRISVSSLFDQVKLTMAASVSHTPEVFLADNQTDLILHETQMDPIVHKDFIERFVASIHSSSSATREALWYALGDRTDIEILSVVDHLAVSGVWEPLWLVRRAIGSAVSGVKVLKSDKISLCLRMISSGRWMDVCVGLIGARFDIQEPALRSCAVDVIGSSLPMDAKWLALLYLCDAGLQEDLDGIDFDSAGFLSSTWAVCELFDRYVYPDGAPGPNVERVERLIKYRPVEEQRIGLAIHAGLTRRVQLSSIGLDAYDAELAKFRSHDVLIKYATQPLRGARQAQMSSSGKWLFSELYGVWRGEVTAELRGIISELRPPDAAQFLMSLALVPSVAVRMAIFRDIRTNPEESKQHYQNLSWGFDDSHPWVRREALRWARELDADGLDLRPAVLAAIQSIPDQRELPGVFDLIFEAVKTTQGLSLSAPDDEITSALRSFKDGLSPQELKSLNRALSLDSVQLGL